MRNALFYMFLTTQNALFYIFQGIQNALFYIFQGIQNALFYTFQGIQNALFYKFRHFPHLFPAQKVFSGKSIKVSLFSANSLLNIWYIAIYANETFLIILQEVSSKYHKIGRSIIKYGYESI